MDPVSQLKLLRKTYPDAKYYLNYSTPLELVVAGILSAQCRDEIVNAATARLFAKYTTARDYTKLDEKELTTITFFRAKAKNIREMAQLVGERHGGEVPRTLEELVELPGVGRKTAHVILQNAFGIVDGVICDTHVIRLSYRLGWTKNTDPKKIEQDLVKLFSKSHWKELPHLLKAHGRAICKAPTPVCSKCVLNSGCPKIGVTKRL